MTSPALPGYQPANSQLPVLINGEPAVNLDQAKAKQIFRININWDTSDTSDQDLDDAPGPHLPEEILVAVDAALDEDEIDLPNLISDHFGFCALSLEYQKISPTAPNIGDPR